MAETVKDAVLSDCGRYRYRLSRRWGGMFGEDHDHVNFVMLNPSTADATADDPTIRRCVGFAKSWGFSGLVVTNLYAFRATDPADLWKASDPIGPENESHLIACATDAAIVVAAWGAHGARGGRGRKVLDLLRRFDVYPHCIARTLGGEPSHPLYLKGDLRPVRHDENDYGGIRA